MKVSARRMVKVGKVNGNLILPPLAEGPWEAAERVPIAEPENYA